MNIARITLSILGILFGAFMFVYGGYDDSPGAQLLGVMAIVAGILYLVKRKKKIPGPFQ